MTQQTPQRGELWAVKLWHRTRWLAARVIVERSYDQPQLGWIVHYPNLPNSPMAHWHKHIKFIQRLEVRNV